jgi:hypothetical protein
MRGYIHYLASVLGASAALMGCAARAEVQDMRPENLRAIASHVFNGKLARIYSSVEQSAEWETIQSVAELQLARVEKGSYAGRLVYVRFWRRRFIGKGPPPDGAYGHRQVPVVGSVVRVFVTEGEDGGYDVVSPNGFSLISAPAEKPETSEPG